MVANRRIGEMNTCGARAMWRKFRENFHEHHSRACHETAEEHYGHRIRRALQRSHRAGASHTPTATHNSQGKPLAQILPYTSGKMRGKKAQRIEPLNPLEGSILYEGDLISPIDVKWKVMS
jgi:hypothetical protein